MQEKPYFCYTNPKGSKKISEMKKVIEKPFMFDIAYRWI